MLFLAEGEKGDKEKEKKICGELLFKLVAAMINRC
jgi:hypothetical protein